MKIEVGKTYETREGKLVRVICTDARSNYPIIGLVEGIDEDRVKQWACDGRFVLNNTNPCDLVREHTPLTYRWHYVRKDRSVGYGWKEGGHFSDEDIGLIKLAFDLSGNLVVDKCEITGAQPNG